MNASPSAVHTQIVTYVKHYTDRLFSFRVTRPKSLRFRSGEFIMIGLPDETGKPIMRAYSIASPAWDEELQFYSIKVPDGPLTSRLQNIQIGDTILLKPKSVGTLVLDALIPGERLFMIATGTGIAPFASLIREPETFDKFGQIFLTHTCRDSEELNFGSELIAEIKNDPLVGDYSDKIHYLPTTTRSESANKGRITSWIETDKITSYFNAPPIDAERDKFMICGSIDLNRDMSALLTNRGFSEGSNSKPADFTIEKAFVG